MSGTPNTTGTFTFTVRVIDSAGNTAEQAFTQEVLVTLPPLDLRITKWGSAAVPGRVLDYFILVENRGDAAAQDVEVVELLHPAFSSLESVDPPAVADVQTLFDLSTIVWRLPAVAPGGYEILSYQARLDSATPLGAEVVGGPACSAVDLASTWASCLVKSVKAGAVTAPRCAPICATVGPFCIAPDPWLNADCGIAVAACGGCLATSQYNLYEAVSQCMKAAEENLQCISFPEKAVAPLDPNEKGVTASTFIPPGQQLLYPIHFENVSPDVEAKDVFLTDTLDTDLDLSTAEVFSPAGGFTALPVDQTVILKEQPHTRTIDVGGVPVEQTYTETWSVSLDSATRTLQWKLLNINLAPGATDNVLVSLKPLLGLPAGTEIRNTATIRFEIFDPLTTNEVRNVIDDVPPTCTVDPLPANSPGTAIPLSWTATDRVGKVDTHTLFVSEDGGPFRQHQTTGDTSLTFTGQPGKQYGFLCIARDTAGNTEVQNPVAEATTVTPINQPPVANAGADQTAECASENGATVKMDGTKSSDPDGDTLTYTWTANGISFDDPKSATPSATFPFGTTPVTLVVNDGSVDSPPSTMVITVEDTTAPTIAAAWEPVDVEEDEGEFMIKFSATDVCDSKPTVRGVVQTPSLEGLETELATEDFMKLEFDLDEKQVEIKGPDPGALLDQLKTFIGFLVESGRRAFVEVHDEAGQEFTVDADEILHIEAPTPVLRVTAEDASKNAVTVNVNPEFASEDNED